MNAAALGCESASESLTESVLYQKHGRHHRQAHETIWVSYQPFLLSRGYQLRPRYHPDWSPSWTISGASLNPNDCEDSLRFYLNTCALDAIRLEDGQKVVLKRVATNSMELRISKILSTEQARSDPRNRTIPILDIFPSLESPEETFLVMPYMRRFTFPPFHCCSEFLEAMRQFLQGLQFMHDNHIAHLDIAPKNMMMEESRVVPRGSHFADQSSHSGTSQTFWWKDRCSLDSVQYYYIDFGLSKHFPEGSATARTVGRYRGFEEIPELSNTVPYDPFKVDICQLGMTVLKVVEPYPSLWVFKPLGQQMCMKNPDDRPTCTQALTILEDIARQLSKHQLRAAIWKTGDTLIYRIIRTFCGCSFGADHL